MHGYKKNTMKLMCPSMPISCKFYNFIVVIDQKMYLLEKKTDNMKELFQDIHIDSIMTFLRQINLFNKI